MLQMDDAIRIAIGLVLVRAAAGKLMSPRLFVHGLSTIVPRRTAPLLAVTLVCVELALGVAHVSDYRIELATPAAVVLFALFAAVTHSRIRGNMGGPCLCFDVTTDEVSSHTLVRVYTLLMGECFLLGRDYLSPLVLEAARPTTSDSFAVDRIVGVVVVLMLGHLMAPTWAVLTVHR